MCRVGGPRCPAGNASASGASKVRRKASRAYRNELSDIAASAGAAPEVVAAIRSLPASALADAAAAMGADPEEVSLTARPPAASKRHPLSPVHQKTLDTLAAENIDLSGAVHKHFTAQVAEMAHTAGEGERPYADVNVDAIGEDRDDLDAAREEAEMVADRYRLAADYTARYGRGEDKDEREKALRTYGVEAARYAMAAEARQLALHPNLDHLSATSLENERYRISCDMESWQRAAAADDPRAAKVLSDYAAYQGHIDTRLNQLGVLHGTAEKDATPTDTAAKDERDVTQQTAEQRRAEAIAAGGVAVTDPKDYYRGEKKREQVLRNAAKAAHDLDRYKHDASLQLAQMIHAGQDTDEIYALADQAGIDRDAVESDVRYLEGSRPLSPSKMRQERTKFDRYLGNRKKLDEYENFLRQESLNAAASDPAVLAEADKKAWKEADDSRLREKFVQHPNSQMQRMVDTRREMYATDKDCLGMMENQKAYWDKKLESAHKLVNNRDEYVRAFREGDLEKIKEVSNLTGMPYSCPGEGMPARLVDTSNSATSARWEGFWVAGSEGWENGKAADPYVVGTYTLPAGHVGRYIDRVAEVLPECEEHARKLDRTIADIQSGKPRGKAPFEARHVRDRMTLIARAVTDDSVQTLSTSNRDDYDFHDITPHGLNTAITYAYNLGHGKPQDTPLPDDVREDLMARVREETLSADMVPRGTEEDRRTYRELPVWTLRSLMEQAYAHGDPKSDD